MTTFFIFPDMFKPHLKNTKLKTPEDYENYNAEDYKHFHVFMLTHLATPIDINALTDNANIIANIPTKEIIKVTYEQLLELGVKFGHGEIV